MLISQGFLLYKYSQKIGVIKISTKILFEYVPSAKRVCGIENILICQESSTVSNAICYLHLCNCLRCLDECRWRPPTACGRVLNVGTGTDWPNVIVIQPKPPVRVALLPEQRFVIIHVVSRFVHSVQNLCARAHHPCDQDGRRRKKKNNEETSHQFRCWLPRYCSNWIETTCHGRLVSGIQACHYARRA